MENIMITKEEAEPDLFNETISIYQTNILSHDILDI
jgi:hypothetical protein